MRGVKEMIISDRCGWLCKKGFLKVYDFRLVTNEMVTYVMSMGAKNKYTIFQCSIDTYNKTEKGVASVVITVRMFELE